jgi:hypothetical protein
MLVERARNDELSLATSLGGRKRPHCPVSLQRSSFLLPTRHEGAVYHARVGFVADTVLLPPTPVAIVVFAFGLVLYFIPSIVAAGRHALSTGLVTFNVLLGWTMIGWAAALVVALVRPSRQRSAV